MVSGIIVNYLLECEDTGFHVPCTFDNIKSRLHDVTVDVSGDHCDGIQECDAVIYQCPQSFC